MRIGRDNNFLSIELNSLDGGYPAFRVEAVATASGRKFNASHDRLMMDASETTLREFENFESLKSEQIKIPLSEGSWLHFQRDARGYITVQYRIAGWKASAAMEGEIMIEGEFAGAFCREFGALLRGRQ